MKKVKKVLALFLVLCLCFGTAACKKQKTPTDSDNESGITGGGYSSNTEEGYNDTVSDWEEQNGGQENVDGSVGFDNTANTGVPTPTPGQNTNDVVTNLNGSTAGTTTATKRDFGDSPLSNPDLLQYYYEGSCYAYGIDGAGGEYIAFKSKAGELLNVLAGAGKYVLNTSSNVLVIGMNGVKSFKPTMKDGFDAVVVDYKVVGAAAKDSDIQFTYIFKENCISVAAQVNANTNTYTISALRSKFTRAFLTDYIDEEVKINPQWIYPENGDYPYPEFESLCFKTQLTKDVYLYSFQRGDTIKETYDIRNIDSAEMPLSISDSKGLFYTHEYDLTFVDTLYENNEGADYRGLFKSLNSDFAAGISPVNGSDDNSTVFVGNSVDLNINVTNLTEDDLKFSLRYDVRDYYGNIVAKGIFIDSTVYQYTGANRTVKVSGKYGIYYLNLYVVSKYSSYIECYPFALLEKYTYKYNNTSPWGINTAQTKNDTEIINTAKLFAKIGVSNSRGASGLLVEKSGELGITRWNALTAQENLKESGVQNYVAHVLNIAKNASKYVDSFEVGNEVNLATIGGSISPYDQYVKFHKYMFIPTYKALKEQYPNLKYIATPFSACQQEWVEQLTLGYNEDTDGDGIAETHIDGIWNLLDIVSTHIYGTPQMPDEYGMYQPKYKGGTWCIEGALQRIDECFELYCEDKTEKDLYITEVGYATSPEDPTKVDLRTHADYLVRSGILCSAYGADRIQYYCVYDRVSYSSGFNNDDDEWNFGVFYEPDLYGRIKPKPWTAAYANMTRVLESIEKNSMHIYDKYDEGYTKAGVRAFKCNTALNGEVIIAYSNYEVLSNGKKNAVGNTGDRTPNLPWNNQWQKVDETVFDAKGDVVTVIDIMGNRTEYKAESGKVTIPLTGSPIYILGAK